MNRSTTRIDAPLSPIASEKPVTPNGLKDYLSAQRLLIGLLISIFGAELIAMLLLFSGVVPQLEKSPLLLSLLDALLLIGLSFPLIYVFFFKPLKQQIQKREQAEQLIQDREKRYRSLVESSPDAIIEIDARGQILFCNEKSLSLLGYQDPQDLIGRQVFDLIAPQMVDQARQALQAGLLDRSNHSAEISFIRQDDQPIPLEFSYSVLAEEGSSANQIIGVGRDISLRKAQEAEILRQNSELRQRLAELETMDSINLALIQSLDLYQTLQLIVDSVPRLLGNQLQVVIHLYDPEKELLTPTIWNQELQSGKPALQLKPGEGIAGRVFSSGVLANIPDISQEPRYIPASTPLTSYSLLVACLQSGGQAYGTLSVLCAGQAVFTTADEKRLTWLANSAAIAIHTSQLYAAERSQRQFAEGLVAAAAALNARLNLEQVMQTLAEQARLLLDTEHVLVMRIDGEQVHFACPNSPRIDAAQETWPVVDFLPQEELVEILDNRQTKVFDYWPGDSVPGCIQQLRDHTVICVPLQASQTVSGLLCLFTPPGEPVLPDSRLRLEALASQAALSIQNAILYRDLEEIIIQEHKMRNQLIQAEKLAAVGRMIATVAHELNNPLQTIRNCIYLTSQDTPADSQVHDYLGMAFSETERLTNLVEQLREVYRPSSQRLDEQVSLLSLAREIRALLEPHLRRNQLELDFSPGEADLFVTGSHDQLIQVLLNICLNGIEAMQPGKGKLCLELAQENGMGLIVIKDSGRGIPPDQLQRIFDPFYTTKASGTGLGLAISQDIILQHGGKIEVTSEAGRGTLVQVRLPANAAGKSNGGGR